ncbi:HSP20 family protein [Pseudonocardia thermophila]|uniref:HSP20 family protein n=1 Tax=Pseudonocardia thermophila TaxID=1848 RepID=A0A1M6V321_PSETH|nr:Hsp20/alpha crystallin family protein [Pseudonocardia thermophila]SHK75755.1 HSP20 family protein [Pseudonocardia thermophila]
MSTIMRQDRELTPFAWGERLLDEWFRSLPMRRPFGFAWDWPGEDLIRVDEFREGDTVVIKAEVPGIDPAEDVEITVSDGILNIKAERRLEADREDKGYVRHELRYGSMSRSLPLPAGVKESDIKATYKDGILEIRVPVPAEPEASKAITIPVSTA